MAKKRVFANGIPYVRFGKGERVLLVFGGGPGTFLPSGFMRRVMGHFKHLEKHFEICAVSRKSELPEGYTTRDMAEDYAELIRNEFDGGPVDVMGTSYGGLIAQHLAADHPELIRRLVIAMSCYRFSEEGNKLDLHYAELLSEGKRREAFSSLSVIMGSGLKVRILSFFMSLIGPLMMGKPEHPSDLVVEGKAEMMHNTKNRLSDIKAPTLVVGGDKDYYCPVNLLRETAEGIPDAKLVIYEGKSHMVTGKQFEEDVVAFLNEHTVL